MVNQTSPIAAVRLVLCMIVRNESAVIERCLESAFPHVDGYVISDTGSTDGTVDRINEIAGRFPIDGTVVDEEWRDFGHNRTLSAHRARAWAAERGWPPAATYLLFLDADMVLEVGAGFDKQRLSADSYDVIQDNGSLRYPNLRLARLTHEWVAVGATHEYWQAVPADATSARLDTLEIRDVGDGGSRGDKFQRDIALLRRELSVDADGPRTTFYLAQSYFDLGRWSDAAQWYRRRIELGGWDEECWYARYRLGVCLLNLGDDARGAGVLLEAFDVRPSRAEPLLALARHHRVAGRHSAALVMARRGLEVPYPDGDVLFVEKDVYAWQLWEEVMISAYYAGAAYRDLGFSACERLLETRGHDAAFYAYVAGNESYYLPPLEHEEAGALTIDPSPGRSYATALIEAGPTPARIGGGSRLIAALADAAAGGDDPGSTAPSAGRAVVSIPWDPRAPSAQPVPVDADRAIISGVTGLGSDLVALRLTVHGDRIWFSALGGATEAQAEGRRVVVGRMDERLDALDRLVAVSDPLPPDVDPHWVLWPRADGLRVIRSFDPFVVVALDPITLDILAVDESHPAFRAARLVGRCAPVPIPERTGRWLAIVQESATREDTLVECHRWVEIDDLEGLVGYSRPFVFDHAGREDAVGLLDVDGDHLLVTYTIEGTDARWATCSWTKVIASLRSREGPDDAGTAGPTSPGDGHQVPSSSVAGLPGRTPAHA